MPTLEKLTGGNILVTDTNDAWVQDISKINTDDSGTYAVLHKPLQNSNTQPIKVLWSSITGTAQTTYNDWNTYISTEFA